MTSARETMTNEVIQGNEWAAYGALDTYHLDETRDHLRARAYGDRALVVLVRVTPHQGVWESYMQGEAAQVKTFSRERARDVPILNRRNVFTEKPDDTETVLSGLGRGGEKRPSDGTSLAAYFIALPLIGVYAQIYQVMIVWWTEKKSRFGGDRGK
jgi:hypothetical protein